MSFSPVLPVGGVVDEVKRIGRIDHIDGITFPENAFPTLFGKYMKGLRMELPAAIAPFSVEYQLPVEMEFAEISFAATGYSDGDYWEMFIGLPPGPTPPGGTQPPERVFELIYETIYTKELPQSIVAGNGIGNITKLPAGTIIRMVFHNESAASKTVYYDLKFFK